MVKTRRKFPEKRSEKWIDSPGGTDMIPLPRDGETVTADSKGCPPLSVVSVFPPAALQRGRPGLRQKSETEDAVREGSVCEATRALAVSQWRSEREILEVERRAGSIQEWLVCGVIATGWAS
jgi:hypothetical protein